MDSISAKIHVVGVLYSCFFHFRLFTRFGGELVPFISISSFVGGFLFFATVLVPKARFLRLVPLFINLLHPEYCVRG